MTKNERIASLEKLGFITRDQVEEFQEHQKKKIFSLNTELLSLMYLSVLLFTSGVGVLIYKNIDSIGHSMILGLIFIVTIACFYFSLKKAKGFTKEQASFENPVYDYVVLTGSLLATIFVGYLQFQYQILGSDYQWVSLISAIICFVIAYYFDQRTVLSMAITSLITFVGITLTPQALFENEVYSNAHLSYYGLFLAIIFLYWVYFSERQQLKMHFNFVYWTFAQHLSGICIIAGLIDENWGIFVLFSIAINYYFFRLSHQIQEISLFVFALIYGYIGLNIILARILSLIDIDEFFTLIALLMPAYVIFSIILFIKAFRNFKKKKHASV